MKRRYKYTAELVTRNIDPRTPNGFKALVAAVDEAAADGKRFVQMFVSRDFPAFGMDVYGIFEEAVEAPAVAPKPAAEPKRKPGRPKKVEKDA